MNTTHLENMEEISSGFDEFLFETEISVFEQEYEQDQHRNEEMGEEETTLEENKLENQEIKMQMFLSNLEEKIKWDKYKYYIDELVLNELQSTVISRYTIQ